MFIPVDLNRGLRLKHLVLSRQKITRLVRDFPLGSASSNTRVIPMGTAAALCLSPALHFEPETSQFLFQSWWGKTGALSRQHHQATISNSFEI